MRTWKILFLALLCLAACQPAVETAESDTTGPRNVILFITGSVKPRAQDGAYVGGVTDTLTTQALSGR